MIGTAPTTALEAIRSNNNQISGLVKHAGSDMVDVALVLLLDQIFALTLSPVSNLQPFSVMIRKEFWDLRFEEIQYVLIRGINGAYGKIYGHLSYPIIAEWIREYKATERAAVVDARAIERQSNARQAMNEADFGDDSIISGLIKKFKAEPVKKAEPHSASLTDTLYDLKVLEELKANISNVPNDDLRKLYDHMQQNRHTKSADYIFEEIERRI